MEMTNEILLDINSNLDFILWMMFALVLVCAGNSFK